MTKKVIHKRKSNHTHNLKKSYSKSKNKHNHEGKQIRWMLIAVTLLILLFMGISTFYKVEVETYELREITSVLSSASSNGGLIVQTDEGAIIESERTITQESNVSVTKNVSLLSYWLKSY